MTKLPAEGLIVTLSYRIVVQSYQYTGILLDASDRGRTRLG
jgi:hypothetical protein